MPSGITAVELAESFAELLDTGSAVELVGWDADGDAIVCVLRLTEVHPRGVHVAGVLLRDVIRTTASMR